MSAAPQPTANRFERSPAGGSGTDTAVHETSVVLVAPGQCLDPAVHGTEVPQGLAVASLLGEAVGDQVLNLGQSGVPGGHRAQGVAVPHEPGLAAQRD